MTRIEAEEAYRKARMAMNTTWSWVVKSGKKVKAARIAFEVANHAAACDVHSDSKALAAAQAKDAYAVAKDARGVMKDLHAQAENDYDEAQDTVVCEYFKELDAEETA